MRSILYYRSGKRAHLTARRHVWFPLSVKLQGHGNFPRKLQRSSAPRRMWIKMLQTEVTDLRVVANRVRAKSLRVKMLPAKTDKKLE